VDAVIVEANERGIGRGECEARFQRAVFFVGGRDPKLAGPDLEWIINNPNEHIRSCEIARRAADLLAKVRSVLNKEEVEAVLNALGDATGGWYKGTHWNACPNGHLYLIGDCGGAMVRSSCPDCGAVVGGGDHRLAAGNANVPSMAAVVETAMAANAAVVAAHVTLPADESNAALIARQNQEYERALLQDRTRQAQAAAAVIAPAPAVVAAVPVALLPPAAPAVVGEETAPGPGVIDIRVRVRDINFRRRFRVTDDAVDVFRWVQWHMANIGEALPARWLLLADRPRREVRVDSELTLGQLGIDAPATLLFEELD
jgi:hypothetical protein